MQENFNENGFWFQSLHTCRCIVDRYFISCQIREFFFCNLISAVRRNLIISQKVSTLTIHLPFHFFDFKSTLMMCLEEEEEKGCVVQHNSSYIIRHFQFQFSLHHKSSILKGILHHLRWIETPFLLFRWHFGPRHLICLHACRRKHKFRQIK